MGESLASKHVRTVLENIHVIISDVGPVLVSVDVAPPKED